VLFPRHDSEDRLVHNKLSFTSEMKTLSNDDTNKQQALPSILNVEERVSL